jgi:hypothetical protein
VTTLDAAFSTFAAVSGVVLLVPILPARKCHTVVHVADKRVNGDKAMLSRNPKNTFAVFASVLSSPFRVNLVPKLVDKFLAVKSTNLLCLSWIKFLKL